MQGLDVRLAEVLVVAVVDARDRVEAEAVLGRRVERVAVPARPAVAVTQVDDDRGAGERLLHGGPCRIGRVDLDDLGAGLPGRDGRLVRESLEVGGGAADGPDDDRDARDRRSRPRGGRGARRRDDGDEERDE